MANQIWHNGDWREDGPVFTMHDRIRLGDGVFDTMLAVDGSLQNAEAHFERLRRHAAVLSIELPCTAETLTDTAQNCITKNDNDKGHVLIRTLVSRGESHRGIGVPGDPKVQIVIRSANLPPAEQMPPPRVIIAKSTRRNEYSPLSQIKCFQYADNILAKMEADAAGANDAILLNTAGNATCTTTGNLYALIDDVLCTPPIHDGVIDGIIRGILLKSGAAKERSLSANDLASAEGLYLSNSLRGMVKIETLAGSGFPKALPAESFTNS